MNELKKMAGINTAITAVGTVAGGVALGTGIAKQKIDQDYKTLKAKIDKLILEDTEPQINILADKEDFNNQIDIFIKNYSGNKDNLKNDTEKLKELEKKSKTLGHIRTGTLATAAVSDTAGLIIATKNKVDDDLESKIKNCITEITKLKNAKIQAEVKKKY